MLFSRIRAACVAVTLLLASFFTLTATPTRARAQVFLDMFVDPNTRTVNAGTTSFWDVILTNNTGGDVTLNLTAFTPGFPLTPDVDVAIGTLPGGPIALADGQSFVLSNFLTTTIPSSAASSTYDALAEITYDATDADNNDFLDITAAADWQLTVQAQPGGTDAPEPASAALLLTVPLLSLAPVSRRRKRRSLEEPGSTATKLGADDASFAGAARRL